jgi:hypothetical protein
MKIIPLSSRFQWHSCGGRNKETRYRTYNSSYRLSLLKWLICVVSFLYRKLATSRVFVQKSYRVSKMDSYLKNLILNRNKPEGLNRKIWRQLAVSFLWAAVAHLANWPSLGKANGIWFPARAGRFFPSLCLSGSRTHVVFFLMGSRVWSRPLTCIWYRY